MPTKKKVVRKRARNEKGQFKGDDPKTPFINEAYENKYTVKDYLFFVIILGVLVYLAMTL